MEQSLETKASETPAQAPRMKRGLRNTLFALSLSLASCAGLTRSCSSCSAEQFASDWLVVQYDMQGKPYNCWKLEETSVTNEPHSDGIYWLDGISQNLVHISGWYNRVQVERNQWDEAARSVGVDTAKCTGGTYSLQ